VADPSISSQPYLSFYNSEKLYTAPYKYRIRKQTILFNGVNNYWDSKVMDRWYLDDPRNGRDDGDNCFGDLADATTRKYIVEAAGAYTGEGVKLTIKSAYNPPAFGAEGYGTLTVVAEVSGAGA
jgi:hypothetical protein